MRITGPDVTAAVGFQKKENAEAVAAKESSKTDSAEKAGLAAPSASTVADDATVSLSERVSEVGQLREAAKAEPRLREEVVEKAKADIANGRLQADPLRLSELIARDLF